jgi:hypothetical protein
MTNPRGPTTCPACGGKNFNWARCCDHCGASFSGSLDDATTSSEASPENVADIDPPKIPTMPPFNKGAALAGLAAIYLYFRAMEFLNPSPAVMLGLIVSISMGQVLYAVGRRAINFWQLRKTVHLLRQFDAEQRATMFAGALVPLELGYRLADQGHPERIGLVDRFTFSPTDLRELSIMAWTSVVAAVGILVTTTVLEMPVAVWLIAVGCVALRCITAVLCLRGRSRMRRAFEVSPFGLSEIHDDGTIRRIVWGAGVTLRNHASRRRIELSVTSADSCIDIPYSVVGFSRLVGLIVAKGGFVVDGPEAV